MPYVVDVANSLRYSFTEVLGLNLITKLQGFVHTCGGTRWDGRPEHSLLGGEVHLHSWVTTGIEDHAGENLLY